VSSDNGLILQRTSQGWELYEYCASLDQTFEQMHSYGVFDSAEDALLASRKIHTEYGLSFEEGDS